jgi:endonuclease III
VKKSERINNLLIQKFGIPKKSASAPDPLDMMIATILSQNTTDGNSFKAFQNLKRRFLKWKDILDVSSQELENTIRIAGLPQQKASAIKSLLEYLNNTKGDISLNYLSELPDETIIEELTHIKGIGVKTASCVLLFSLQRNVCPVDTHVHRVLNRIQIVRTSSPEKTFYEINKKLPEGIAHQFHTNIIRLGREVCKPAVPVCYLCPLKKLCKYPAKDFSKKVLYKENDFFLLDNV